MNKEERTLSDEDLAMWCSPLIIIGLPVCRVALDQEWP